MLEKYALWIWQMVRKSLSGASDREESWESHSTNNQLSCCVRVVEDLALFTSKLMPSNTLTATLTLAVTPFPGWSVYQSIVQVDQRGNSFFCLVGV